jgi:hypothetical protein
LTVVVVVVHPILSLGQVRGHDPQQKEVSVNGILMNIWNSVDNVNDFDYQMQNNY